MMFCFMTAIHTMAQDHKEAFLEFKESHKEGYNAFVDQIDKDFADFLRKNWVEFQIHSGKKVQDKHKPIKFPKSDIDKIDSRQSEFEPPANFNLNDGLVMPVNYKESTFKGNALFSTFDFFGEVVSLKYVPDLKIELSADIDPSVIAEFWESISAIDYRLTLDDLFFYKDKFSLNDFGYYLLIKRFSESVVSDSNQSVLMTWYLLAKSKFKVKVGYSSNEIFILLPSKMQVYGTSYFDLEGLTYYVMDYTGNKMLTYNDHYELAYKPIDFSISSELELKENLKQRHLEYTFQGRAYKLDFTYNLNAIDFYKEYPQIELNGYFNSVLTSIAVKSIMENLQPIVDEMNELEAVNFLLSLVQNGFSYQIDQEQFGREKAFFPEEILHYPFSDCEDRSVFFAYLVSTLLGNEVMGLDYPEHVAVAVHFNSDVPGDYYIFDNKKYIVCDPTYRNAPVGMSMKGLSASKANLILKNNPIPASDNLLARMKKLFGIEGDIDFPKVIEVESGKIVAANYLGDLYVQNENILSSGRSMFIAKYDKSNQLKWINSSEISAQLIDIISSDNETYVLQKKEDKNESNNTLTKMDLTGGILWETGIKEITPVYANSNTQVTLYTQNGERLAGKTYVESDFFEGRRLHIKNEKVLVILPMSHK